MKIATTVTLDADLRATLADIAARDKRPLSNVTEDAVRSGLIQLGELPGPVPAGK